MEDGHFDSLIPRSSSEPAPLLSVYRHSSPAAVQANCQVTLSLFLDLYYCVLLSPAFKTYAMPLSMKLLRLASYVEIFSKYIGVCDHLCNVISTYLFSKSSIKVDWMIHFVHWGGKEQSSISLFYFTYYHVFLKVLFNIHLHYISLFSYFKYCYYINIYA